MDRFNAQQRKAYETAISGHNVLITGQGGVGKCLSPETNVLMFDGTVKQAKEIIVGDLLMGDDSSPRTVLSTCSGREKMYRIDTTKGDSFVCNAPHILTLKCSTSKSMRWTPSRESYAVTWCEKGTMRKKSFGIRKYGSKDVAQEKAEKFFAGLTDSKGEVVDIGLQDYLAKSESWKDQYRAFKVGVEYPLFSEPLPLDPYFLGIWLGDGHAHKPAITTVDSEIIGFVSTYAKDWGLQVTREGPIGYVLSVGVKRAGIPNPINQRLRDLNLLKNKHIPHRFMTGTRTTRLKVLAGIIDTDGSLSNNCYDIIQKSKKLADDILFLSRSLGFAAYLRQTTKGWWYRGVYKKETYHRVSISGEGLEHIPVLLSRKKAWPRKQIKDALVHRFKVTPLEEGDYCGFTLDGNGRFLLGNFLVTHNTWVIGKIKEELARRNTPYAVTASTGAAAVLINGITLHRWAGIGLGKRSAEQLAREINTFPKRKQARENWHDTQVLIVDEISMLDGELFDKLDLVGRLVRGHYRMDRRCLPFGGLQLVLCGDFAQLPPVKAVGGFCFQSKCWNKVIKPFNRIELVEVIRQSEGHFRKALGEIRMGEVSKETQDLLRSRVDAKVGTELIKPTILLSHREGVKRKNEEELAKIQAPVKEFKAHDRIFPSPKGGPKVEREMIDRANKNLQPREVVRLKVGAQVMLICNISNNLVNGSRGVVTGYQQGWPIVEFLNGERIVATPHRWKVKVSDKTYMEREQVPLILAYAVTIHKSQGATLDCVEIDISRCFEHGQAYVALSRVRTLEGLSIRGNDMSRITAHPLVKTFYNQLREIRQPPKPKPRMKAYPVKTDVGPFPPLKKPTQRKTLTLNLPPIKATSPRLKRERPQKQKQKTSSSKRKKSKQ